MSRYLQKMDRKYWHSSGSELFLPGAGPVQLLDIYSSFVPLILSPALPCEADQFGFFYLYFIVQPCKPKQTQLLIVVL
jgi:hypothetical protein